MTDEAPVPNAVPEEPAPAAEPEAKPEPEPEPPAPAVKLGTLVKPAAAAAAPRSAFAVGRAAADSPDGFDVDAAVHYLALHPRARLAIVLTIFCLNFFLHAEDPIAHSRVEASMPILGPAVSLIGSNYPSLKDIELVVAKALCAALPFLLGASLGRRVVHHALLRDRFQLPMFAGSQGSWLVMLLSGALACFAVGVPVYNALLGMLVDDDAKRGRLEVDASVGFTEEALGAMSALSTFLLDFFMGMAVLDLMLQDEEQYPFSLTWLRALYRGRRRLVLYYTLWTLAVLAVVPLVLMPVTGELLGRWWDDFNYDKLPTTEYTRGFIASVIVFLDALVVAQDWDFAEFRSKAFVRLPGLNLSEVRIRRLGIVITHKWYCYCAVFLVMIFDLNNMKNQLIYAPGEYGQYTGEDGHIYVVPEAAANDPATVLSMSARRGLDDDRLAARFHDSSTAWKLLACLPAACGVIFFFFYAASVSESRKWAARRKKSVTKLRDSFATETERRRSSLPAAAATATVAVTDAPTAVLSRTAALYRAADGGDSQTKSVIAGESERSMRIRTLKWVTFLMCDDPSSSKTATVIHAWLTFVVLASIGAFCVQTLDEEEYNMPDAKFWWTLELFFSLIFTLEVGVRFMVSESYWTRLADSTAVPFFHDVLNWFDLAAILPFYLELITVGMPDDDESSSTDTTLDLVRLLRVARIFKVMRNFSGWAVILRAAKASLVPLVLPIFFLFLFSMIFATLLFWVEPCEGDADDCPFTDVFNAGYFVIVTMTTVGYGDQVPESSIGRGLAVVCMMFGACFMAMPLAILGHEFERSWKDAHEDTVDESMLIETTPVLTASDDPPFPKLRRLLPRAMKEYFAVSHSLAALSMQLERLQEYMTSQAVAQAEEEAGEDAPLSLRTTKMQETIAPAVDRLVAEHRQFIDTFQTLLSPYFKPKSLKGGDLVRPVHLRNMTISEEKMRQQARENASYSMDDVDRAIMSKKLTDKLWLVMEVPGSSRAADRVSTFIMICVCTSIFIFCMQTVPELEDVQSELQTAQFLFVTIFTIEFVLRAIVCPSLRKFFREPTNYVDLFAVLPFYVELALDYDEAADDNDASGSSSSSSVNGLRLLAVIRVFKILRHFSGTEVLVETARQTWQRLIVPLFVFALCTILFGSLMFTFEKGDKRDETYEYSAWCGGSSPANASCSFNGTRLSSDYYGTDGEVSPFKDLFNAAWLIVVTMTTVGYGVMTPITPLGKGVAMVSMLFGTFYLAMPLTIVGNVFVKLFVAEAKARRQEQAAMQLVLDLEYNERADPLYAKRRQTLHNLFAYFSGEGPNFDNQAIERADLASVMVFTGDLSPGHQPTPEQKNEFLLKVGVSSNGRIMEPQFVQFCLLTVARRLSPELDAAKGTGDWSGFDEYIEGWLSYYSTRPLLTVSDAELELWSQYLNDTLAHLGKLQLVCAPPLFKTAIAVCYELLARVQQLHANFALVMNQSVYPKLEEVGEERNRSDD